MGLLALQIGLVRLTLETVTRVLASQFPERRSKPLELQEPAPELGKLYGTAAPRGSQEVGKKLLRVIALDLNGSTQEGGLSNRRSLFTILLLVSSGAKAQDTEGARFPI